MSDSLIASTIKLYERIDPALLPTPARPHIHIQFARHCQGCAGFAYVQLQAHCFECGLARLWVHECHRVFRDRMINVDDMEWVNVELEGLCRECHWPEHG